MQEREKIFEHCQQKQIYASCTAAALCFQAKFCIPMEEFQSTRDHELWVQVVFKSDFPGNDHNHCGKAVEL